MSEREFEFLPYFLSYKNGRVERFFGTDVVPASLGSETGFSSEDVTFVPENTTISARLFMPSSITVTADRKRKRKRRLPLLIYFHGGAYVCLAHHSAPLTTAISLLVVASAKVVAISIDYRLAPEHPLPAAFEDSWDALKWAASHSAGHGPEAWLNEYADFQRVFVAGDSAGSTIAHAMAGEIGFLPPSGGIGNNSSKINS